MKTNLCFWISSLKELIPVKPSKISLEKFLLIALLLLNSVGVLGQYSGSGIFNQVTTSASLTSGNYLIVGDSANDGLMENTTSTTPYINFLKLTNPGASITTGFTAANVFEMNETRRRDIIRTKPVITTSPIAVVYVNGDYRSFNDGDWHGTASSGSSNTWQQLISGVWTVISNSPPSNAASLGTNKVYINSNISLVGTNSAPYVIVLQNGILTSDVTVTFGNLLVKSGGEFYRMNNATGMNSSGVFEIEDGGYVYITQTDKNVPSIWEGTEKFHSNSNIVIKRLDAGDIIALSTTISPYTDANGNSAYFGNLIIDSSVDMAIMNGVDATATRVTNGNLILRKGTAGTSSFVFAKGTGTSTSITPYIIGGDFIIESTFTGTSSLRESVNTTYVKVNKDFIMNGSSTFRMGTAATGVYMVVDGNININDTCKFYFMNSSVAALYTLSLKGDITVESGASFTNANANTIIGNADFYFAGNGDGTTDVLSQRIDIAPTTGSNAKINFNVNAGSYTKLINQNLALGTNSNFTVKTGGTLDFGFSDTTALNIVRVYEPTLSSGQSFISQPGSILKITSPLGITFYPDYNGNVQIGGKDSRNYDGNATYHYIGKANQESGNGLPNSEGDKKVIVELSNDLYTFQPKGLKKINAGGYLEIRRGTVLDNSTGGFVDGTSPGNLKMTGGKY